MTLKQRYLFYSPVNRQGSQPPLVNCRGGITYTAAGGAQLRNLSYSYDADGRRTAMGGSLAAVNLPTAVSGNTFNADNEMTGFNGTTLSHDANGNLTSDGTNTYTWDARNHLTGISGGASASFVYDAFGRRVSKTINGATTQFLYDELNPVQELNGSNPPTPTANLLTGLGIDEHFTRTDSNGTMNFLTDALGSTIALANSSGAIATQYTYEPFGKTTMSGSSNTNPYQFTGRENDGDGLYYYRARYYSPKLQRFIAQDPIGFLAGPNLYSYVGNSPTDFIDPLGETQQDRWYGYGDPRFQRWVHGQKEKGQPDFTQDQLDKLWDEWNNLGSPDPRDKNPRRPGGRRPACDQPGESPGPEPDAEPDGGSNTSKAIIIGAGVMIVGGVIVVTGGAGAPLVLVF